MTVHYDVCFKHCHILQPMALCIKFIMCIKICINDMNKETYSKLNWIYMYKLNIVSQVIQSYYDLCFLWVFFF